MQMGEFILNMKPKLLSVVLITIIISIFLSSISLRNSAEPPSIVIIVPNAPNNLEISIGSGDTYAKARKVDKLIETQFIFYSRELSMASDYTFKINTKDINYDITLEKPINSYNNIFTLDLDNQTLTPGKLLSRSILLVSIRIILTLIIEAIIFWLYGFRHKKSWIAFLAINLVTQGALNIWLNGFAPINSYLFLTLIFAEFFIIIAEATLFLALIKEQSKSARVLYVLVANTLSLIAGGYAITLLPI